MKNFIVVAAITFITSAVVHYANNVEALNNDALFQMPMKIDRWSGHDLPMEDWVFESLETPYAIMRNYQSDKGDNLNLAIVWYDDKDVAFHAPEACLGGVGNTVKNKRAYKINVDERLESEIGELIVNQGNRSQLVLYYFINDGYITPSQIKLRTEILKNRFKLKRTSAAFVRIMTDIEKNPESTRSMLEAFLKISFPTINAFTHTKNALVQ